MRRRYECRTCGRRFWLKSGWISCLFGHWYDEAGKS